MKITNDRIIVTVPGQDLFSLNSRQISENAEKILTPIAKAANLNKQLALTILGHTDGIKSAEESRVVSRKRAEHVKKILVDELGINVNRIHADGKGRDQPVASNASLDGRRANRRIEILFTKGCSTGVPLSCNFWID